MIAATEPTTDLDAYFAAAGEAELLRADRDGTVTQMARANHSDNFGVATAGYVSFGIIDAVDVDRRSHVEWFNAFSADASVKDGDGRPVFHQSRSPFIRKITDKVWEALRA